MRTLLPLLLLPLLACSSETGILIAVSGSEVDAIEFQVARLQGEELMLDRSASGTRADVRGRNLRARPYELMLLEESTAGEPDTVVVLALGYQEDRLRSMDLLEPPQVFIHGEVLRRSLRLEAVGESRSVAIPGAARSCFRVWLAQEKQHSKLHVAEDADCDGYTPPADCDDASESIHPGATELCDGKDNNCDGVYADASYPCYGPLETTCREGSRRCRDSEGLGLEGECQVTAAGRLMPQTYCRAYAACSRPDPLDCVAGRIVTLGCTVAADAKGICGGTYTLTNTTGASVDHCRWQVVDPAGWGIGLSDPAICETTLTVKRLSPTGSGPAILEVVVGAGGEDSWVVRVELTVKSVDLCGEKPLECSWSG